MAGIASLNTLGISFMVARPMLAVFIAGAFMLTQPAFFRPFS
jgi:hypothetical protein